MEGEVIRYDEKEKFYKISYFDGDSEEMTHADEISNSDTIPDKDKAGEPMKLPPIPPTTSSEDEGGAGQKLELLRSA